MNDFAAKNIGSQCSLCHSEYDLYYRTPRVIPKCGHTFCEKCIANSLSVRANRKVFICPGECGKEAVIRKSVSEDLPKNAGIIEIIKNMKRYSSNDRQQERKSLPSEVCMEHSRPLELVCETCKFKKICSHCALFGEHKSHSFCKEIPATKVDLGELKEIFEIVSDSVGQTLLPNSPCNIKETMRVRAKEGLHKHITACFKPYLQMIKKRQLELLQESEGIVINQGGIDKNIDQIIREYDYLKDKYDNEWKTAIQDNKNKPKRVITLDQIDQYINKCKEVHSSVENIAKHAQQHIDQIVKQIGLKIMQTTMFKIQEMPFSLKRAVMEAINGGNGLQSPEKPLRLKTNNSETKAKSAIQKEQSMISNYQTLDRNSHKSQNKTVLIQKKGRQSFNKTSKLYQHQESVHLDPKPSQTEVPHFKQFKELKEVAPNKNIEKNSDRSSIPPKATRPKISNVQGNDSKITSNNNQKEDKNKPSVSPAKTVSAASKDKDKSINVGFLTEELKFVRPTRQISFQFLSKFQEIMVEVDRQSTLNCLELVGAEINDILLLYILDYMRIKKYRFQIIKLVKNFLTDQGFKMLLSLLVNDNTTQVLNLTSNQLTALSLQLILLFASRNNILRTIYLSNNKISSFQLKSKKADLQKFQLEVII